MWLKLGEFRYTLSLHTWSTLILPLINVRADHCVLYAGQQIRNRRDTRHTLWCMWLKLGEFHYTLSLHTWSTLIQSLINVQADHCVIRICRITNEEPQGYEAYSVVYVIESLWVSLYIITAHLKHTNSIINQCPSWSLCYMYMQDNEWGTAGIRGILCCLCDWNFVSFIIRTLSLHTWSTLILLLINV